jgi:large subunit ribosomal protein L33
MSQDHLIKLESQGDESGLGKGHIIYGRKNKKMTPKRLEIKKYNPEARKHTIYRETK